jgi:hypothetical protein
VRPGRNAEGWGSLAQYPGTQINLFPSVMKNMMMMILTDDLSIITTRVRWTFSQITWSTSRLSANSPA